MTDFLRPSSIVPANEGAGIFHAGYSLAEQAQIVLPGNSAKETLVPGNYLIDSEELDALPEDYVVYEWSEVSGEPLGIPKTTKLLDWLAKLSMFDTKEWSPPELQQLGISVSAAVDIRKWDNGQHYNN